jgi:hypothetical protein
MQSLRVGTLLQQFQEKSPGLDWYLAATQVRQESWRMKVGDVHKVDRAVDPLAPSVHPARFGRQEN